MTILNRKQYAHLRKMTYEQMNKWAEEFYKQAYQDGANAQPTQADEITEDELFKILLSVQGVGMKQAQKILSALKNKE